jgi:hypothetical protein
MARDVAMRRAEDDRSTEPDAHDDWDTSATAATTTESAYRLRIYSGPAAASTPRGTTRVRIYR